MTRPSRHYLVSDHGDRIDVAVMTEHHGLERLVQLPGSDDLANEVSSALLVIKRRDEHADAHADRVCTCP